MKKLIITLLALLALAVPFAVAALEVKEQDGISYVTGGVGIEEREILREMEKDFNLKLVLATKAGPYLSGTKIEILDAAGKTVLSTQAEGPFFYARLPAGNYTVKAGGESNVQGRSITLGKTAGSMNFYW